MGRLGCPVLDIPHAEHPLIHHSSHPRIWCPISLQFWFVCTWRVKTDDTNDFEWEMYRAINIHNHLNFDLFIIWIIYGNLNATSLEWWLARVTIPKYVQPDFRVGELLHFVSRTHVCIYIYGISPAIYRWYYQLMFTRVFYSSQRSIHGRLLANAGLRRAERRAEHLAVAVSQKWMRSWSWWCADMWPTLSTLSVPWRGGSWIIAL
jgi:hypothetical protein